MKRLKNKIIKWFQAHTKFLKWVTYIFNATAFIALLLWLFKIESICGFEIKIALDGLFTLLTAIAVTLNQLYDWVLSESEYSPAHALALGYVNNFIAPTITQLIENGETNPKIFIYKPDDITELFPTNIDKVKAEIRNRSFDLNEIKLSLKHGRARDILTIQKSKTKKIYFDFPNTLTSLIAYIDYKISSGKNQSSEKAKRILTKKLIKEFYSKIDELLSDMKLSKYVSYCDYNLNFTF